MKYEYIAECPSEYSGSISRTIKVQCVGWIFEIEPLPGWFEGKDITLCAYSLDSAFEYNWRTLAKQLSLEQMNVAVRNFVIECEWGDANVSTAQLIGTARLSTPPVAQLHSLPDKPPTPRRKIS